MFTVDASLEKRTPGTKYGAANTNVQKEHKSFEDVYEAMGPLGRYQIIQNMMLLTCTIPLVFVFAKYIFMTIEADFKCSPVNQTQLFQPLPKITNGTSFYLASYNESCEIQIFRNESGSLKRVKDVDCINGYDFEGGNDMSFISEWGLVCDEEGVAQMAQAVVALGLLVGGAVTNIFADKYGRWAVMFVAIILSAVVDIATAYTPDIYTMIALRFLTGVVSAGMYCSFLLAFEMVVDKYRILFSMISGVFWSLTDVVFCGIAYAFRNNGWRDLQLYSAIMGLFPLFFIFFIDESPIWLHSMGYKDRAEKIIRRTCRINGVDYNQVKGTLNECFEALELEKEVEGTNDVKAKELGGSKKNEPKIYTVLDFCRHRKLLVIVGIGWFSCFTNEITNSGLYLTASTLAGDLYLNQALLGLVSVPAYFASWILLMYKGRKFVIVIFTLMSGICLLISPFISYGDLDKNTSDNLTLVFFISGKFAITGAYNTLFLYIPEVFPTSLRATGTGLSLSGATVGASLAPFLLPLSKIVSWAPGVILSACCLFTSLLFLKAPETRGKKLTTSLYNTSDNENEKDEVFKSTQF